MTNLFFRKELVSHAVIVNGKPVKWEQLDGNRGVIQVNPDTDKHLADGLLALANEQRGGVIRITELQYADLKKNLPYNPLKVSVAAQKHMLRAMPHNADPFRKQASAAVVKPLDALKAEEAPAPPVESLGEQPAPAAKPFQPATARLGRKGGKLALAMQQQLT